MSKIKLYVFSISHFCEKARWALDYHQIDYELVPLMPVDYIAKARELGFKRGSLPILETSDRAIQGSSEIISWADENSCNKRVALTPANDLDYAREIEQRLDDLVGVHLRRMFYSEALVEHSSSVRRVFAYQQSWLNKAKLLLIWPKVRGFMIKAMDLGRDQGKESEAILEQEMLWLTSLLSERDYLIEDRFTRVDLTAASLLSRLVSPNNFPSKDGFQMPPRASQFASQEKLASILEWVNDIYFKHRV